MYVGVVIRDVVGISGDVGNFVVVIVVVVFVVVVVVVVVVV